MCTVLNIITGHLDDGSRITPTPTAMAVTAYLATLTESVHLTIRQLAGDVDRDVRSVRRAVMQLVEFGLPIVLDNDYVDYTIVKSITVQEDCLDEYQNDAIYPVESVVTMGIPDTQQLSLFDNVEPIRTPSVVKSEPVMMAASRISKPKNPEKQDVCKDCATLAQPLHNDCTNGVQIVNEVRKTGKNGLAESMERLAKTMESNISTRDTHTCTDARPPVQRINQEYILNQSTNVAPISTNTTISTLVINNNPTKKPKFDAKERKKRLSEIQQRFPTLAEHVAGTLANMMAYGTMPENVYYQALHDAQQPTVRNVGAFLNHKIQEFKKEYRYCKN